MEPRALEARAHLSPPRRERRVDVTIADLESAGRRAFENAGADADTARRAAREMVANQLDGDAAYGLQWLGDLVAAMDSGDLDPAAEPRVERTGDRSWRLDGHRAMPCDIAHQVRRTLVEGARDGGMASVAVTSRNPLGRMASIAGPVADAGLLVLGFSRSRHDAGTVVAHGGRIGKLGSNPMVFAAPAGEAESSHGPVVVDLTTSAASAGEVRHRVAEEQPVPDGWLTDRDGQPVDHGAGLDTGEAFLLPLGGRAQGDKGFGLALMVEILAGVLTGARLTDAVDGGDGDEERAFFVALSPALAGRDEASVRRDVEALAQDLLDSGEGSRVDIPGWKARELRQQRLVDGSLALPTPLWNEVLRLAEGGLTTVDDRDAKSPPVSTPVSNLKPMPEAAPVSEDPSPAPVAEVASLADYRGRSRRVPPAPEATTLDSEPSPNERPAAE